jgi:hypothetical protein
VAKREDRRRLSPKEKRNRQTLRATWIGSIAGVLSLLVAVLVWHPWSSGSSSRPRIVVDATTQDGAATFENFIRSHDGQVVYIEVSCDEYGSDSKKIDPKSHCWFQDMDNYSTESPKAFWLSTFSQTQTAYEWWNQSANDSEAGRGELWTYFPEKPQGSSAFFSSNGGNGSSGAGGLKAKGYFSVVITGSGSLGPTGLDMVDLRPELTPSN